MPFSAKSDAEKYWRTRYGKPVATTVRAFYDGTSGAGDPYGAMPRDETPNAFAGRGAPLAGSSLRDAVPLEKSNRHKKRLIKNSFPSARPRRLRYWFVIPFGGLTAVAFITLPPAENGAPLQRAEAARTVQGVESGPAGRPEAALQRFLEAHEASLVALRGFLLTDGEGFRTEWLDATLRMQAAMHALDALSASWTDGQRLVELVEAKRIVARLLAEERAVAAIVGTANRYPGLQIFREDIRPALAEAQEVSAAVMSAMLAVSSPDSVGPVGPFAAFRGDLEKLRDEISAYVTAPAAHARPASASAGNFSARREMLTAIRAEAPQDTQRQIDRLMTLMAQTQEKFERIAALEEGNRWDYAAFAFRTRVTPLAERLEAIAAGWDKAM